MPDWTSLLSPGSRRRGGNDYIADMLIQQGADTSPIGSPFQGLARLAQAYAGKKMMDRGAEDRQAGNQTLAGLLAPPTDSVSNGPQQSAPLPGGGSVDYQNPVISTKVDPRNAQIADLLGAGIGKEQFTGQALDKLGFGPKPTLQKFGKDDRGYLPDASSPTGYKEVIAAAPPPEDFSKPIDPRTGKEHPRALEIERDLAGRRRPQVSVNVSAAKAFGSQLGENAGKILDASHAAAQGGVQTLTTTAQIKGALATGKVTAGPGASAIQFFNQIAGGDPQKVVETRKTIQGLAQLTMAGRSALKGQGQISDYEGKLLAKASSGDIDSMTVKEIETIANVAERNARISIKLNRENVAKARKAAPNNQELVDFYDVQEPAEAPKKSGRFTIEQVQ